MGSRIGQWVRRNVDWSLGEVYCAWKTDDLRRSELSRNRLSKRYAALSVHWPIIFTSNEISKYHHFLNIHPGYLPLGRGTFPIFWSILENSIAGVSTHQITTKVDSGPILLRTKVCFGEDESAQVLAGRIHEVEKVHFKEVTEILQEFPEKLPYLEIYEEEGPNRKMKEFISFRDNPPLDTMNSDQIARLVLALTHEDYKLPQWVYDPRYDGILRIKQSR